MGTFTDRATEVAENLRYLGLGVITPVAYDELAAADSRVENAVSKVVNGLAGEPDYPTLASQIVAGDLTVAKAATKIAGPSGARVQNLAAAVRTAAVAAEDRGEWSATALRRSVVPVVAERLQRTAEDMLSSIKALPEVCRDHLTAVTEGDSVHYGPLQADQLDGLLDVVAPGRDLGSVSPEALAAVQRARSSWQWWNQAAGDTFDPLFWLGTGLTGTATYSGDRVGAGAAEAEQFDPALLLVAGADVDYVAAGLKLPYLVASGLVTELKPIADPFNEDAAEYAERVARAAQFREWRDEGRETVLAGAAHLAGSANMRELRQRARLNKLDAVAAFRCQL